MNNQQRKIIALVSICAAITISDSAFAATFFGPTPYLSSADSPFVGTSFDYFYLEDFEDSLLNTPGVTASGSWNTNIQSAYTDSVDADDGAIDGSGTAGHSFFSQFTNTSLTITFNAAALGGSLPTHAGIVWTDVGENYFAEGVFGPQPVTFSATNNIGASLGGIGPFSIGDGVITGTTDEDRFFGVFNADGISSITIDMGVRNNWEVDHIQYGYAVVPIPAAVWLFSSGLLGLVGISRHKKSV